MALVRPLEEPAILRAEDGVAAYRRYDPVMRIDDRRRALLVDTLLAAAVLGLAVATARQPTGSDSARDLDPLGYALMGLQALPIIWRRRSPAVVLGIVTAAFMVDRGLNYPDNWASAGAAFAIYTVGAQLPARRSLLIGGIAIDLVLAWTIVGMIVYDVPMESIFPELALLALPLILGREAFQREQRVVALEAQAIRVEHEREQQAADAVFTERVRIARELHDVIAHEITVMTIQSGAALRVLDNQEKAAAAISAAETAGHRALTEMRRLLGMLRAPTRDPLPQPGLESVGALLVQMERAGMPVALNVEGMVRDLPTGIDLNAYRIIQESLTNTLKHGGPGVRARVDLLYNDSELAIQISDNGRGAAGNLSGASGGQGLIGMQERAAILDGSLEAGPRPGGGFRVAAKIPIPA
jgi:signal transduction histidine kinase